VLERMVMAMLLIGMSAQVLASGLHDPTRPIGFQAAVVSSAGDSAAKPQEAPLEVSEIQLSPRRHTAVINGKRLSVGERIGKARLVGIEPGRVVMMRAGRRLELVLVKSDVRRPVKNKARRK